MVMLVLSLDSAMATQQQTYTRNHLINYQINISPLEDATDYAQAKIVQRKTATITVEEKEILLKLDRYKYQSLLSTYYSAEDFLVDELSSEEAKGVIFTGKFRGEKVENAYVHFAFLNFCKTLPEVEKFINDKDGLITSNRWRVVFRTQKVPYFWAKEKIVFGV